MTIRARLPTFTLALALAAVTATPARADQVFTTPGQHTFTVPAGVTSIEVTAVGGRGGLGGLSGGAGGFGAVAVGDLAVTPGQTLYVVVGGNGAQGQGAFPPGTVFGGPGGSNGGGRGGDAEPSSPFGNPIPAYTGGGGGGASDVRTIAVSDTANTLGSRLIVAAGGGGGGGGYDDTGSAAPTNGGAGGAASSLPGAPGTGGVDECSSFGSPGGGGQPGGAVPPSGGTAVSPALAGQNGGQGTGGAGGDGFTNNDVGSNSGGGGGGGLTGGGGGGGSNCAAAGAGGGGAGQSLLGGTNTALYTDLFGVPSVALRWGTSAGGDVVISQVYGGGQTSAPPTPAYNRDFIELFNRGTSAVDLTGWSVQYGGAAGSSFSGKTDLPNGLTIQPGKYVLIAEAAGAEGSPLPTPDVDSGIGMGQTAGKVALVSNQTLMSTTGCPPMTPSIRDFVGYGSTANCFEGSGPAPTIDASQSAARAGNGCADTDDNSSDFAVSSSPVARNSATPAVDCSPATNDPPGASCGGTLRTQLGAAAARQVSASDVDGRIVDFALSSVTPAPSAGSITLGDEAPAVTIGGDATANVSVSDAVPVGTYTVAITASNDDASPQQASCQFDVVVERPPAPPPDDGGQPPPAPVADYVAPEVAEALGLTFLDARRSQNASLYLWDVNGDNRDDVACPGDQPVLGARFATALPRGAGTTALSVRLTAVSASGAVDRSSQTLTVRTLTGSDRGTADRFMQPFACRGAATLTVRRLPCQNTTLNFGVVTAKACMERVTGRGSVPAGEMAAVDEAIRQFNENERTKTYLWDSYCISLPGVQSDCFQSREERTKTITRKEIDPLLAATDFYVSREPVQVNGLRYEPQGSATIVVFPQIGRIISSNAAVRMGGARLPLASKVNLNVEPPGVQNANPLVNSGRITLGEWPLSGPIGDFAGFLQIGSVKIDLVDAPGGGYSEAAMSLALPRVFDVFGDAPPSARTAVRAYNDRGPVIDNINISVPRANLGGLVFENVGFRYNAAGDREAGCARKFWKATASVFFGLGDDAGGFRLNPPPSQNGIAFCEGSFKSAGGELRFGPGFIPPPQVFPGVFLNSINFAAQLNPTLVRGGGSLQVARVADIDGVLLSAFPSSRAPYTLSSADAGEQLKPLAGKTFTTTTIAMGGTAGLQVPAFGRLQLGNAYLLYSYPDYVAMGGGAFIVLPGMSARLSVDGEIGIARRVFSFKGRGELCILVEGICVGADAWLTSKGVVLCGDILGEIHPGAGYMWGATFPEIWFPDGCKPSGYWETNIRGRRAQNGGRTFRVGSGVDEQRVRLFGSGDAPQVEVRGPDGEVVSTARGNPVTGDRISLLRHTPSKITYIGVARPKPGVYTITPLPGSSGISRVETSQPAEAPRIRASVSGRGERRTLTYDVERQRAQRVTFFERGTASYQRIGAVAGGKGTFRFKPDQTGTKRRRIVALVEIGGFRVGEPTVARYSFAPPRPGRPGELRLRRRGKAVTAAWGAARNAVRYGVILQRSNGSQKVLRVGARKRRVRFKRIPLTQGGRVTVRALDARGASGRPRTARFQRTKKGKTRFRPFSELGG